MAGAKRTMPFGHARHCLNLPEHASMHVSALPNTLECAHNNSGETRNCENREQACKHEINREHDAACCSS
eukprot:3631876-Alexandrium_andersonii.AAC.1